jgi:hypothetical protein
MVNYIITDKSNELPQLLVIVNYVNLINVICVMKIIITTEVNVFIAPLPIWYMKIIV